MKTATVYGHNPEGSMAGRQLRRGRARLGPGLIPILMLFGCASSDAGHASEATLFAARGDGWSLKMTKDVITLHERHRRLRFDWSGVVQSPAIASNMLVYTGQLEHIFVVAGLAEETVTNYELSIEGHSCTDARGKAWPTRVFVKLSHDYQYIGCGSALPLPKGP